VAREKKLPGREKKVKVLNEIGKVDAHGSKNCSRCETKRGPFYVRRRKGNKDPEKARKCKRKKKKKHGSREISTKKKR